MVERDETLREAYWKLREHASAYRSTAGFRRSYEAWQADRDDPRAYQKHVVHEFYAKGIEAAAEDIAEMLGVPEHEIEPAGIRGGGR
jgi:hypothetical protein